MNKLLCVLIFFCVCFWSSLLYAQEKVLVDGKEGIWWEKSVAAKMLTDLDSLNKRLKNANAQIKELESKVALKDQSLKLADQVIGMWKKKAEVEKSIADQHWNSLVATNEHLARVRKNYMTSGSWKLVVGIVVGGILTSVAFFAARRD